MNITKLFMDCTIVQSLSLGFTLYGLFLYLHFYFYVCLLLLHLGARVGRRGKLVFASFFFISTTD